MKTFEVYGNIPKVGPVTVTVQAYNSQVAMSQAKAMYSGKGDWTGVREIKQG